MKLMPLVQRIEDKFGRHDWWLNPDFQGSKEQKQLKKWRRDHQDNQKNEKVYYELINNQTGETEKFRDLLEVRKFALGPGSPLYHPEWYRFNLAKATKYLAQHGYRLERRFYK